MPHLCPHVPQLFLSVEVLTQAPEQAASPALHWMAHWLLTQVGVPLVGAGQTWPQAPQLSASLLASTHLPLQGTNEAAHSNAHVPALQRGLPLVGAVQTVAHLPQFEVSDCKSTQEPEHSVLVPHVLAHLPD